MQREKIKVEKRKITGKQVKKLRREGLLPANVYGKDFKSLACQVSLKEFKSLFNKVHETGLVDLELDSKVLPVLIHNIQLDPRTQEPLHADFYKVDLKEKIRANVPLVSVDESPAVIDNKGLLLQLLSEVEVEALPTDLPEKIEVSIANLKEVNDEITVAQLKPPTGVTIVNDPSQIVLKIGELVTRETEELAKAEEAAAVEAKATSEVAKATEEVQVPQGEQPQATAAPTEQKEESKEQKPQNGRE